MSTVTKQMLPSKYSAKMPPLNHQGKSKITKTIFYNYDCLSCISGSQSSESVCHGEVNHHDGKRQSGAELYQSGL